MENEVKQEVKVETKKKGNGLFTVFACVMTGAIVFMATNLGEKASKVVDPDTNSGTTTSNVESNITSNIESNITSNKTSLAQQINDVYVMELYRFNDAASMNKYYNGQIEYQKQAATGGKIDVITNNENVYEAILYEVPNEYLPLLEKSIYCYVLYVRKGNDLIAVYTSNINPNTTDIKNIGTALKSRLATDNIDALFNEYVSANSLKSTEDVFDKESLAKQGCYKAVSASKDVVTTTTTTTTTISNAEALSVGKNLYAKALENSINPLNATKCTKLSGDDSETVYDCTKLQNNLKEIFVANSKELKVATLKNGKYIYTAGATGVVGNFTTTLSVVSVSADKLVFTANTTIDYGTVGGTDKETDAFEVVKENGTWKISKFTYQPTTLK